MNFAVNIESIYREIPFAERFAQAKQDGFDMVEIWAWDNKNIEELQSLLKQNNLTISCMGGDGPFSLCDPTHDSEYLAYFEQSLAMAQRLGVKHLAIHSDALLPEPQQYAAPLPAGVSDLEKMLTMYRTLTRMAPMAERAGITLCLEPLNVEVDHVGNFLKHTKDAAELLKLVNSPNIKILYDAYHMYLNEGKLCKTLKKYLPQIGIVHIADAPGRHEPGTGFINFRAIIDYLKTQDYQGIVAFELYPQASSALAIEAIKKTFL